MYAGLQSARTAQGRADLVLAELKRTGAFDRKVLVVATTTGMGFLDRYATNTLEYAWNGDTAIAGVQYSYLPSWISLLADQEAVVDTSRIVFETVRDHWATLPESDRPALYLYGLSLGSKGVEGVLSSVNILNASVDGALMVGPPFVNDLHARLVSGRDEGSRSTLPVYEGGRTVRFMDESGDLEQTPGPWGPTRVVYLQHASDPVTFFSTDLAFERPAWLRDDERGPDVSERMGWFPVVTMWQVLLDMPGAGRSRTGTVTCTRPPRTSGRGWPSRTRRTGRRSASSASSRPSAGADPKPYSRTAPSSIPAMKWRCRNRYSTTTGSATMTAPAASSVNPGCTGPGSTPAPAAPCAATRETTMTSGMRNSFQVHMNTSTSA